MHRVKTQITKENLKNKIKGGAGKICAAAAGIMFAVPHPVSAAAGFDTAINMIALIKNGLTAIISGVGVIIVVKNAGEIGTALSEQRNNEIKGPIMGAIGGVFMAGVGVFLTAAGLS